MAWQWVVAVVLFAWVSSISPGPVNIIIFHLALKRQYGLALRFITGASVGFCALLLLVGWGLTQWLSTTWFTWVIKSLGTVFLLWLSLLMLKNPPVELKIDEQATTQPLGRFFSQIRLGFIAGNLIQWLNPKAWFASTLAVGLYVQPRIVFHQPLYWLVGIYGIICWFCLSFWLGLGIIVRKQQRIALVWFNYVMAILLVVVAIMSWW